MLVDSVVVTGVWFQGPPRALLEEVTSVRKPWHMRTLDGVAWKLFDE